MELFVWFERGGIVMWPILLCSIAGLYIIIERFLTYRSAKPSSDTLIVKLRRVLGEKDVRLAQQMCVQEASPVGRIVGAGLEKIHHGPMRVRQAMEDQGREEITLLERHLGMLASVAGVAPMLGFLGTVTGLIAAFQAVALAVGQPSPSDLADGIWEALITTVFGLVVGIPAAAAYNYLVNQVLAISAKYERIARESLDAIEEAFHISRDRAGLRDAGREAGREAGGVPAEEQAAADNFTLKLRREESRR